jgi:PilZ domain-containing protein
VSAESRLSETVTRLESLERWEWWRWGTVLVISITLTLGMFSLKYPNIRPDIVSANDLDRTLWGLLGLVLLFDLFALYQQFKISRLRRELSNQIAMLSTLEVLRPANPVEEVERRNRRKTPRFYLDQRLKVVITDANLKAVFGRTRDISEGGLGGVIADPLEPGTRVELEFPVPVQDLPLRMTAVVCFRRGFHHGFEFLVRDTNDINVIKRICAEAALVP